MATLNIGGHSVSVDDSFLSLPQDQQNATVDEIARSLPIKATDRSNPIVSAVTDIPTETMSALTSSAAAANAGLNPLSQAAQDQTQRQLKSAQDHPLDVLSPFLDKSASLASGVMGLLGMPGSIISGPARSLIGHPLAAVTPDDPRLSPEQNTPDAKYARAKADVDKALLAMRPSSGLSEFGPPAQPPVPPNQGPLGVTLSKGQETGELPLIQKEQAALRGQIGDPAQARAQQFADQQKIQLGTARDNIAKAMDPAQQIIADSPQQAGQYVSQGLKNAADIRKTAVDDAYATARGMPGEINAGVFEGLPQKIKGDLTLSPEPVIVDQNTPAAMRMLNYLDQQIGNLKIQNAADPFGPPDPQNIVGVNLNGVDQWRKSLGALKQDAYGNPADMRASKAVMQAFDSHINNAVNGGQFNGPPAAIQSWNDARSQYADYAKLFKAGLNDPVGRVVENVLGTQGKEPLTPNDIADKIYSAAGTNPSTLNVAVANRVKTVLGDQSPEWSAVKQGLWQRLVDAGDGMTEFGPGKVAQRINKFINNDGVELANTVYNPSEKALIQQYADLLRKIEVPQSGANWSNTGASPVFRAIKSQLGQAIGATLGHSVTGVPVLGEAMGMGAAKAVGSVQQAMAARQIAKQMPLVADAMAQYQHALAIYNRLQSPPSKAAVSVAWGNLGSALKPLGIGTKSLGIDPSLIYAPASENKNDVPGRDEHHPADNKPSGNAGLDRFLSEVQSTPTDQKIAKRFKEWKPTKDQIERIQTDPRGQKILARLATLPPGDPTAQMLAYRLTFLGIR